MTMILDGTITFSDATVQNSSSNTYSIGYGQTWQDLTSSRTAGTTYTNSTSKPIYVSIRSSGSPPSLTLNINSLAVFQSYPQNINASQSVAGIVPPGITYSATYAGTGGGISAWYELR